MVIRSGPLHAGDSSEPWRARAADLAEWAWDRLVNRTDAWGAYRRHEDIGREYIRTDGTKGRLGEQQTVRGRLTRSVLANHFKAGERPAIVGLHTAEADNLSKGGALDIDHHGPMSTAPDVNLRAALWWHGELARLGLHPLLIDSNGRGGFHLRILLSEAIPADRLFYFLRDLTRDHKQFGFDRPPEQFPKQPDVRRCSKGLGNWLRLPGRHHKRLFWSRAWSGEYWLEGHAAIDFMLSLKGDPPHLLADIPPPASPTRWRQTYVGSRPGDLSARITAYLARLPHLGEGQGRDDVAFGFAAWLVRDLALPDDEALGWLERWGRGNRPPKGRDRLAQVVANARLYGQRPFGCGRDTARPSIPVGDRMRCRCSGGAAAHPPRP